MRIWEQGLTATYSIPGYKDLILAHYEQYRRTDTRIDVHGLRDLGGPDADAVAGAAVNYLATYYRQELGVHRRLLEADAAGYDAAIIGVMQDPSIEISRSACRLPILGYGEVSMHMACMAGRQFSFVAINPPMTVVLDRQIRAHALQGRAGPTSIMASGYQTLQDAVDGNADEFISSFVSAARVAVAAGSDVLVPGQTIISELLWREGIEDVDGALVLDVRPHLIALAESKGSMRQRGRAVQPSSGFLFASPESSLVESLDNYLADPDHG